MKDTVGRNCKRSKVSDAAATAGSVSEPSHATASASIAPDLGSHILSKLTALTNHITALDGRVRDAETALADRTTDLTASKSHSGSNVANLSSINQAMSVEDSVIPTTDFLKNDNIIQQQVDARFLELQGAANLLQSGKLKSQRGGNSHIPIKKFVPWPHHYILTGKDKKPVSYDQLQPTQWMAGCLKAAMDLPQLDKEQNLNYLVSLLEDASDFCFENAKACHAVVLTEMEHDRLNWQQTDKLDRFRRQHA